MAADYDVVSGVFNLHIAETDFTDDCFTVSLNYARPQAFDSNDTNKQMFLKVYLVCKISGVYLKKSELILRAIGGKLFYILASFIFFSKITNKRAEITAITLPKINGALTPI